MGVTFPNGIFCSIICVASGSEDMSVSMVPFSRAFVGLLIPFGPKIVFIGDRVKGVPSAWLKWRWFRAVSAASIGNWSDMVCCVPPGDGTRMWVMGLGVGRWSAWWHLWYTMRISSLFWICATIFPTDDLPELAYNEASSVMCVVRSVAAFLSAALNACLADLKATLTMSLDGAMSRGISGQIRVRNAVLSFDDLS